MTGADKVVCQAATLLLLFTPHVRAGAGPVRRARRRGGGNDMMTQMAPMLEMMKAKMGKRRFAMMMQTMGPMMSQMMDGGGGFEWDESGRRRNSRRLCWRRHPGGRADGRRRRHHGNARRRRRRRTDGHNSAADADGQFRRRPPASPAAVIHYSSCAEPTGRANARPMTARRRSNAVLLCGAGLLRCARNDVRTTRADRRHRALLGPHRVSTTLSDDRVPSTIIESDASVKKLRGRGIVRRKPPAAARDEQQPRGLRQHRSQHLGRALRRKIHRRREPNEGVHRRRGRQILMAGGAHARHPW